MATRSLVLHIGKNKAGSTAIERKIRRPNTPVARSGLLSSVFRPGTMPLKAFGCPNAKLLASAFQSPRAQEYFVNIRGRFSEAEFPAIETSVWRNAEKELKRSRATRFVASSEYLWSYLEPDDIRLLRRHLQALFDDVRIFVYLRDQRSDLPSVWAL